MNSAPVEILVGRNGEIDKSGIKDIRFGKGEIHSCDG